MMQMKSLFFRTLFGATHRTVKDLGGINMKYLVRVAEVPLFPFRNVDAQR